MTEYVKLGMLGYQRTLVEEPWVGARINFSRVIEHLAYGQRMSMLIEIETLSGALALRRIRPSMDSITR